MNSNNSLFKQFKDTARLHSSHPRNIFDVDDDCPIYLYRGTESSTGPHSKYHRYALCTRNVNMERLYDWVKTQKSKVQTLYNVKLKEVKKGVFNKRRIVIISDIKDSPEKLANEALNVSHTSIMKDKLKVDQAKLEKLKNSDRDLLAFSFNEDDKLPIIRLEEKKARKSLTKDLQSVFQMQETTKKDGNPLKYQIYTIMKFSLPYPDENRSFDALTEPHQNDILLLLCPSEILGEYCNMYYWEFVKFNSYRAMMFTRDNNFIQYYNGPPKSPPEYEDFEEKCQPLIRFKEKCYLKQQRENKDKKIGNELLKIPLVFANWLGSFTRKHGYMMKLKNPISLVLSTCESSNLVIEMLRDISKQQMPQEIRINPSVDCSLNFEHNLCFTDKYGYLYPEAQFHRRYPPHSLFRRDTIQKCLEKNQSHEESRKELIRIIGDGTKQPSMSCEGYSLSIFTIKGYSEFDGDDDLILVIKPCLIDMRQMLSSLDFHHHKIELEEPKFFRGLDCYESIQESAYT